MITPPIQVVRDGSRLPLRGDSFMLT